MSTSSATLAEWTGALDASGQYYFGIWAVSGSGNFTATVEAPVVLEIASQPINLVVTEGQGATFAVVAAGAGTLSYQWYLNDVAITGATAETYSVIATTVADSGNVYRVEVTDNNGTRGPQENRSLVS